MKKNLKNSDKRAFLKALLPLAAFMTLFTSGAKASSLQEINRPDITPERKKTPERERPIIPPGSKDIGSYTEHCAGCQLCVRACPNGALKTSLQSPAPFQPVMSYEFGYCRPNCVKCGEVCPTGAISRLDLAQKAKIKIGLAKVDFEKCIVNRDKVQCSACHRICPNEAISLAAINDGADSLKRPVIDEAKCSGCGACEYICAARPVSAITVEGLKNHEEMNQA